MIGETLSHFRILSSIGRGGMGVVYKAVDEKLHRFVALKVLPTELVSDPDRRLRFFREARAAAAISHPNIATVHEIDESEGVIFIAMEYIEGRTLRALLLASPPTISEALRLSVEIAEGLSRAHQAKVIHRDLKPENVMVSAEGRVKILDFGLAKLVEQGSVAPGGRASALETISREVSRDGQILGTPNYMSPEQARGQEVDVRSDLFSFGVVLYEMATGTRPFEGTGFMDTVSAVISKRPAPVRDLNPDAPEGLEKIIARCLEKDPSRRYQDCRDLVLDLRHLQQGFDSQPSGAITSRRRGRRAVLSISAVILAAAIVAVVHPWSAAGRRAEPGSNVTVRAITANSDENPVASAAISPDGTYLAYVDGTGLFVRLLASGEARQIPTPDGEPARSVSWYPDGTRLLVTSSAAGRQAAVWSASVLTGRSLKVLEEATQDVAVSPDGSLIAFVPWVPRWNELWVVGSMGGQARKILSLEDDEWIVEVLWPPNGRRIAFVKLNPRTHQTSIEIQDLSGGPMTLLEGPSAGVQAAAWTSDGRLLFTRSDPPPGDGAQSVWEMSVDQGTGKRVGEPHRITSFAGLEIEQMSSGAEGKRVIFVRSRAQTDVYVGDLGEGGSVLQSQRRLTLDDRDDVPTDWTLDGRAVIFDSNRDGTRDVFIQGIDNRAAAPLVSSLDEEWGGLVSPGGDSLLYWSRSLSPPSANHELRLMRAPIAGGAGEVLLASSQRLHPIFRCGRQAGAPCVLSQEEGEATVFYRFDPALGRQGVLGRIERGVIAWSWSPWALSPDGSRLAFVGANPGDLSLKLYSVRDGTLRTLPLAGWRPSFPPTPRWAASGDALFVFCDSAVSRTEGSALLRVGLDGTVHVAWRRAMQGSASTPVPSPDGRRLAFQLQTQNRNVWMLEGL